MPTNPNPLSFGTFYHIYNRGNNHENIFLQERNYDYFMELWWKHTSQIAETYAYCLLKNHFHSVVFIKYQEDLTGFRESAPDSKRSPRKCLDTKDVGENLSGLKQKQPSQLVVYIHQNPQKHMFVDDFRDWDYSSYHELTGNAPTRLQRDKMMELFGSREDFIRIHLEIQPLVDFDDGEDGDC